MRIEVTRRFRDMGALTDPARSSEDDPVHEVGATITVTKERGDDLVARGFATEVGSAPPVHARSATRRAAQAARKPAANKPAASTVLRVTATAPDVPAPAPDPAPVAAGN